MGAGITKMYRQILEHKDHTSYKQIFWRHSPQQELSIYDFKESILNVFTGP